MIISSKNDRKKMILAMEYIARQINDETVFDGWLMNGVPDGDIPYGCFDIAQIADDDWLLEDDHFQELMECFLRRMIAAGQSGGLYCDNIVTRDKEITL